MNRNPPQSGFNLIGYATSPMGLGEDLRSFAAMLEYLKINFSVIDLPTDVQGQVKVGWSHLTQISYKTSIFFMSPLECQKLANLHPKLFSEPEKKIGYFLWELPDFPTEQAESLKLVDHIWCPTRFVQEVFFKTSRQLTLSLPLPVVQHPYADADFRELLQIPTDAFVVLFIFDARSTMQRKNPQATVRVFQEFAKSHPEAYLILKISRWKNQRDGDLSWIPKVPNIKVIQQTLTPHELASLYRASDCYLSLHRSEGFGRTLVEALQQGLHMVTTDFSGPKDFLSNENSLLVDWSKITARAGDYPMLSNDSWWCEPDERHALSQLEKARIRVKTSRNLVGIEDGNKFSFESLASKYRPIIKTYL
jgi:glycosyltransferase involved in cell wall biosynthesis